MITDIIKSIFCRHKFVFRRNIYGDEIILRGWYRSKFVCEKCGLIKYEKKLVYKIGAHING